MAKRRVSRLTPAIEPMSRKRLVFEQLESRALMAVVAGEPTLDDVWWHYGDEATWADEVWWDDAAASDAWNWWDDDAFSEDWSWWDTGWAADDPAAWDFAVGDAWPAVDVVDWWDVSATEDAAAAWDGGAPPELSWPVDAWEIDVGAFVDPAFPVDVVNEALDTGAAVSDSQESPQTGVEPVADEPVVVEPVVVEPVVVEPVVVEPVTRDSADTADDLPAIAEQTPPDDFQHPQSITWTEAWAVTSDSEPIASEDTFGDHSFVSEVAWDDSAWEVWAWDDSSWDDSSWNDSSWNDSSWNDSSWNDSSWDDATWEEFAWDETFLEPMIVDESTWIVAAEGASSDADGGVEASAAGGGPIGYFVTSSIGANVPRSMPALDDRRLAVFAQAPFFQDSVPAAAVGPTLVTMPVRFADAVPRECTNHFRSLGEAFAAAVRRPIDDVSAEGPDAPAVSAMAGDDGAAISVATDEESAATSRSPFAGPSFSIGLWRRLVRLSG